MQPSEFVRQQKIDDCHNREKYQELKGIEKHLNVNERWTVVLTVYVPLRINAAAFLTLLYSPGSAGLR
jgi:hypothetical protein